MKSKGAISQEKYRLKHPERIEETRRKFYASHPEQGKVNRIKYADKIKERSRLYREAHREDLLVKKSEYLKTTKGKVAARKFHAKRKGLGFTPLNQPFSGCEGHHINAKEVIYIPKPMHRSVWHSQTLNIGMDKINRLAFEFLEVTR